MVLLPLKIWHYHPEMELVCILESTGTRFIGKSLPHMWLNDDAYFKKPHKRMAEAVAVHFKKDFLGTDFFKRVNRKTFTRYLNEIRIGYACKLMMERKFSTH